jgi:hypothetical protein
VNPTGGGLRNTFGNAFAQTQLPANRIDTGDQLWLGEISKFVAVGSNLRAAALLVDVPDQASTYQYNLQEARVYLAVSPIPDRLTVYIDQLVASQGGPDQNMEAYARYWTANRRWYVQAGRMYLPFGLRLEDDGAFTRLVPQLSMGFPDTGAEVGWESGAWSAQFAITNGTALDSEVDNGKQYTAQGVYVAGRWRLGAAANLNSRDIGDRTAYGVFGGLRTGPIAWLAEADLVTDDSLPEDERDMVTGLLEANWLLRQGHNLKLTAEYYDPSRDLSADQQERYSLVYEYTPVQFLQVRAGARIYDADPETDSLHRKIYFLQLHGFF